MLGLWLDIVSFVNTHAAPVGITIGGWEFYFLDLVVVVLRILFTYDLRGDERKYFPGFPAKSANIATVPLVGRN